MDFVKSFKLSNELCVSLWNCVSPLSTNQHLSPPDPDIMRPFGIMIITAMLLVPVWGDAGNGHDPEFTPPANEHLVTAAAIVAAAPCVFMSGGGERKRHGRAVHMTSED